LLQDGRLLYTSVSLRSVALFLLWKASQYSMALYT